MIYGSEYFESEDLILGTYDFILTWIFPFIFTVLFWIYKSATPGKMALKAVIVDAKTGDLLTTKQSIIRYLAYYISIIPLGLGCLWVAWDQKKQGWHDKIAGTVVIRPVDRGVKNVSFESNR